MQNPSTETSITEIPIINPTSDHSIVVKVKEESEKHIPNMNINFIMNMEEGRVLSVYTSLTDLPQNNLKEYSVDPTNIIYFDPTTKKICGFLMKNESFLPKGADIFKVQKEFVDVLTKAKTPSLLQAYRITSHYWVVLDSGFSYALGKVVMAVEDPNLDPPTT